MANTYTIKLTNAQIDQLLTVLRDAEDEGCYYGNKELYWARHFKIVDTLSNDKRDGDKDV
jgi:hypothetical protein